MEKPDILTSSFRDPSGFVFNYNKQIYRQINHSYKSRYDHLMSSGLYQNLVKENLLVAHEEAEASLLSGDAGYKVILPTRIPYVSYPYEWCFSQLKDAALCTMKIQMLALKYGMVLKDASAYNIQFVDGNPCLIDTLSFEFYEEGKPWHAYKQFCQHFIGPIALMSCTDIRLSQLFRIYIDGPPLDLVSRLLPGKTWFKYSLLVHLHLHARSQHHYADAAEDGQSGVKARSISKPAFTALMHSIESSVSGLHWKLTDTEWGDYYQATNYVDSAMQEKETLLADFLRSLPAKTTLLHDLGANDGRFSRISAKEGFTVISQDIDPVAVEKNYLRGKGNRKGNNETAILPLLQDLTNPSGGIGWALQERDSFLQRCQNETILALALIHHLAISNNVPLGKLADFFAATARFLIIEFVPKEDSQVIRLLATREDIFPDYTIAGFETAFSEQFQIVRKENIKGSTRVLYLLERQDKSLQSNGSE